jgi:hypothetical protein
MTKAKRIMPNRSKLISLHPLSLEEALKKMLQAKPSAKPVSRKRKPSKRA